MAERSVKNGRCHKCNAEHTSRWIKENQDAARAATARWQKENPDTCRESRARWQKANPDAVREHHARWRNQNPDDVRERCANWKKANPDAMRAMKNSRRARKNAAEGSHTAADIQRIHAEQSGLCACCGTPLSPDYHVDHIMPLALGGSNDSRNLQCLCASCNKTKHAKHPYDFSRHYAKLHGAWPLFAVARGWNALTEGALYNKNTLYSTIF
jgi:hypothetical protein